MKSGVTMWWGGQGSGGKNVGKNLVGMVCPLESVEVSARTKEIVQ